MYSVLYVDDEADLLEIGKIYLEEDPELQVETITSAPLALEMLKNRHYDVIVSDYQMPRMNGIDFLKEVRSRFGGIPFILFTGRGREDLVIDAINNGADFYLQKGGDPEAQFAELCHKIRKSIQLKNDKITIEESEQRLASIINFLPDATLAIDKSGVVIAWNRAIEEMTGIPASAMLGKGDYEYAIPFYGERRPILINLILESREEIEKEYQIIRKEKDVLIAETSLPRPKGNPVFLLGKASLLYNREGVVTGAIESIRDISDQKLAEKSLKASEELHRTLFLASPDGIVVADPSGIITHASPRALEIFGMSSPEEAIGKSVLSWISREDVPRARDGLAALMNSGGSHLGQEFSVVRADGTIFPAAINSSTITDSDGKIGGIVAIIRDITRRKLAERSLQESEEKFRTLVERSLDGTIIVDFSGRLLFANPRAGRIIGYESYQDLVGKANVFDFLVPEFRERAKKDFATVIAGKDNYLVTYRITTFTQKEVWIECIGTKIMFEAEPALLISLRDITSRKLIEESLKKTNEKLSILSGITRHDITNELLALDGYLSLLEKKLGANRDSAELVGRLRNVSRKIGAQIRFTKDYEDLGANEPLWQNISTIAKMAAYDNLPESITLSCNSGDYEIFADPMLMLVFYNLFDNARRHGETVRNITLSFVPGSPTGTLVIEDDGAGISEDLKGRIFEKGVGKNTGFGLFLAREILAITGLEIKETGAPGKGARFEISVPEGHWRRESDKPDPVLQDGMGSGR
jgi:PAS domain S-box-containing protein